MNFQNFSGIRVVVAAFGILCGLTGIIAGFFEIQQGNVPTNGVVISTIGSNYSMGDDFTYQAISLIPNFLITGILALIFSSMFLIWSLNYIHRNHGAKILLGIGIGQMLVGGGWVMDLGILTFLLATRIGKSLSSFDSNVPKNIQGWFTKTFPISLLLYTFISLSMLILTIAGVNNESMINLIEPLALVMFLPIVTLIIGGFSYDVQKLKKSKEGELR